MGLSWEVSRSAARTIVALVAATLSLGAMTQFSAPPARAAVVATGVDDNYSMSHDRTLTVAAPGVLGNDLNLLGGATAVLVTDATHGVLDLRSNGRFTYAPGAGFVGNDTFKYRPSGVLSKTATVHIAVTNAAPIARNDAYTWTGGTLTVPPPGVLGNDSDADGDTLTAKLDGGGVSGSFNLDPDGGFQLQPGGGFKSGDTFRYRIWDGRVWSAPATVTLTINAPTPTPSPTPRPTATPTPRPLPSLPLPSIPLPSVSGGATPPPTPGPSGVTAGATARPTPSPSTRPGASPSEGTIVSAPGQPPPGRGGDGGPVAEPPGLRLPSRDGLDLGLGMGGLDVLGSFDTWAVPAATVGGVGLLVLLFAALQAGATVIWVPAVRRLRGERTPRRRLRRR